jgi:hypothetical protein
LCRNCQLARRVGNHTCRGKLIELVLQNLIPIIRTNDLTWVSPSIVRLGWTIRFEEDKFGALKHLHHTCLMLISWLNQQTPRTRCTSSPKPSSPMPCSLDLSATSQLYFSLRTNQPPTISQQYFSLRTNQHQPSTTSQTNKLLVG